MSSATCRSPTKPPRTSSKSSAAATNTARSSSRPTATSSTGATSSTTPPSPPPSSTASYTTPPSSPSTATATACAPTKPPSTPSDPRSQVGNSDDHTRGNPVILDRGGAGVDRARDAVVRCRCRHCPESGGQPERQQLALLLAR